MSARKARQDLKGGLQQLEDMWSSMAEKHLSEFQASWISGQDLAPWSRNQTSYIIIVHYSQHVCTDQDNNRSTLSLVFGAIPHLFILAFTIFVIWTAKPSSSESVNLTNWSSRK